MTSHLVLTVHLHDARYHGAGEWPPAPARVFQALLAGVSRGTHVPDGAANALRWLETLAPPVIAAPRATRGQEVGVFVPNNDADSVGGDPARLSALRVKKSVRPWLLDGQVLLYAWSMCEDRAFASTVILAADEVYQLGRGVDMAWATGEVLEADELDERLSLHRGTLHRPAEGEGTSLACPSPGSFEALVERHHAAIQRFREEGVGKTAQLVFVQPPKPRFRPVVYDAGPRRFLYELRERAAPTRMWPWPIARTVTLIERIRERAAELLRDAQPELADVVDRTVVGRTTDGAAVPTSQRVRVVPLPSIGSEFVDPGVRRVFVEVPSESPLTARDVAWAFSGLETYDPATGVVDAFTLVEATEQGMLVHYGLEAASTTWHTITPIAVPIDAQRRRIEPARRHEQAKPAAERVVEEQRAVAAIRNALRHAGVTSKLVHASVQREPTHARGVRAETFADGTRFAKERLFHADLEFDVPIQGPLVLGDGRFVGLGLLAPAQSTRGIIGFSLDSAQVQVEESVALARAMRRAILARVQRELGAAPIPAGISGHDQDGQPLRSDDASHIALQYDPSRRLLLVIPPHVQARRRPWASEREHASMLHAALADMTDLRAGSVGRFHLTACFDDALADYLQPATTWVSVNYYTVARHARARSAGDAVAQDISAQCIRHGLPEPEITVTQTRAIPGLGLSGRARLVFPRALPGPLLLGRTRYLGGGLFARA